MNMAFDKCTVGQFYMSKYLVFHPPSQSPHTPGITLPSRQVRGQRHLGDCVRLHGRDVSHGDQEPGGELPLLLPFIIVIIIRWAPALWWQGWVASSASCWISLR